MKHRRNNLFGLFFLTEKFCNFSIETHEGMLVKCDFFHFSLARLLTMATVTGSVSSAPNLTNLAPFKKFNILSLDLCCFLNGNDLL